MLSNCCKELHVNEPQMAGKCWAQNISNHLAMDDHFDANFQTEYYTTYGL